MHELLRVLSTIAAIYGIGFGMMSIPTGLFVGPHILLAAAVEIVFGILFLLAALALANRRRWGVWLSLGSSLVVGAIAVWGLLDALREPGSLAWVFFGLFAGYFLLLAGIALALAARPKNGT